MKPSFVFVFLFFNAQILDKNYLDFFVVWDVGQGQWATLVSANHCYHFDMGGEKNPQKRVLAWCKKKINHLSLSHTDKDHINFLKFYKSKIRKLCLTKYPSHIDKKYRGLIESILLCSDLLKSSNFQDLRSSFSLISQKSPVKILFDSSKNKNLKFKKLSSNDLSDIYKIRQGVLISGDSGSKMEKIWRHNISKENNIKYFLIGHHGSHYSNSMELLKKLKKLKLGLASARKSRYGHPHTKVKSRLACIGASLISTNNWRDIYIHF